MLQLIRDRVQSWIAWAIMIMITIPFALWGINQYFHGGADIYAVKVNGAEISQSQLEQATEQQQQTLRERLGDKYDPAMFPQEKVKQRALEGLIESELLTQTAANSGMRISDQLLAATIRGVDSFQQHGKFSEQSYELALRSRGMSPSGFEAQLRRNMLTQQLYDGIVRTDFSTVAERNAAQALYDQRRDVGYFVLPLSKFESKVSVSGEEVKSFYDAHPNAFMQPERVKVAYLELSVPLIAKEIKVSDKELHARYLSQLANYRVPEERRVRHILIRVAPTADAATVKAARAKAEKLVKELRAGASFAAFAKRYSQDPGSANQGGELGFFGRGVMDKAFENAAFTLKVDQISNPVRSAYGFHIIQVEAVRGGTQKPFKDVREQILNDIKTERAEQKYYDEADKLGNLTYEHPDTLDQAAQQLGLTIQTSDYFSRSGGTGLWSNPKLVRAAFSDDVLKQGNNSETIEIEKDHLVVLRDLDHQPEERKPLASVRAEIKAQLLATKATNLGDKDAAVMMQQLAQGAAPTVIAKKAGVKWIREDGLTRDGTKIDPLLLRVIYSMPHPAAGKPTWRYATDSAGDIAMIGLYAIRESKNDNEMTDGSELERADGDASFLAVLDGIRAHADISYPKKNN